mmetsp:Transcript_30630/g.67897  ORF Transcript_30630/g.67897 Transcript_30630/m.67897 type:complete len:653 (+) Transcript_30630:236-2194(+)
MTDDSFGTVSGPFIHIEDPHPAVEQLLGPLFSKVLIFAGPGPHISSLRNYQCFRDKMARLPADALRTIGLPAVPPPTDIDMMALRQVLTEPIYGPFGMQDGWKLNTLGLKALIASPLTSHRALANMIHPRAPGFVLVAMSKRPSTHSDLLDILVDAVLRGNHDQDVVFNLARHPNASANALTTARGLLASATPSSRLPRDAITNFERSLAWNKNTSKRDLAMLSRNRDLSVREAVGLNLNTDVADLVTLSSDTDDNVRRAVAANPNLPRETMIAMSMGDSGNANVRAAVARNTSVDKEFASLLVSLCNDDDMQVLRNLACNPNVSVDDCFDLQQPLHQAILADYSEAPHTLRTLAGMEDDDLLLSVATNKFTPADVLSSLAGSTNLEVRYSVAGNANTSPEVLEQLSSDTDEDVRLPVAINKHAPVTVLETLASDDAYDVREFAADNINTPPHVLELLSKDEDVRVRSSVAMNKSTPAHILEAMLEVNEDNEEFMISFLRNPNLSVDILSNAVMRELDRADEGERNPLQNFMALRDTFSRLLKLPVGTLVALSQSAEVFVRRKMATNPLLPTARLILMSRDSDNVAVKNLAHNPTIEMAVDKLSCLLTRSGVGRNKRPIAEISTYPLASNPTVQMAVDELSCLLVRSGVARN